MKRKSNFGWIELFRGIIFLLLSGILLFFPQIAFSGVIVYLGITAVISGLFDIGIYKRVRKRASHKDTLALITGIISITAGILLILNPVIAKWLLNIIIPIWFIIQCISRITYYSSVKQSSRVLYIIAVCLNIIGILFSILMLFNSALFTMSLKILIAVNLIMMGISNIAEAFNNPNKRDDVDYYIH